MKKFADILNENDDGVVDNEIAVELIVKEFDFIRKTLFPYIKKLMDNVKPNLVTDRFSDISQISTVSQDANGDYYLKYLGIYFEIPLDNLFDADVDLGRYFTSLREEISKVFILKNDAITKGRSTNFFKIQIDYDQFKKSATYKSIKVIDKYKL